MDAFVHADKNKAMATFKASVLARKRSGSACSNDTLAHEVLLAWKAANDDPSHKFKHGRNEASKTPSPDAAQPYSRFSKYLDGRQGQKLSGWKICAEVLGCNVVDLVHGKSRYPELESIIALERRKIFAGSAAVDGLANIEISEPRPLDGKNQVNPDSEDTQHISLDVRLIFNSRDDLWEEPQGGKRYTCRIVLTQARVDAEFEKKGVFIVNGVAIEGQVTTRALVISYLGAFPENKGMSWRVLPLIGKTLDGVSELLYQFCDLEAVLTKNDTVSISVEPHWISIASLESEEPEATMEAGQITEIKNHIRRQILNRALQSRLSNKSLASPSGQTRWVLAQREFMSGFEDEN